MAAQSFYRGIDRDITQRGALCIQGSDRGLQRVG
jgi:hypothetical protein